MSVLAAEYSHGGLYFDYSGIRLKAEGKSPAEGFSELLGIGIAALVINDLGTESQAVLNGTELPSRQTNAMRNAGHCFKRVVITRTISGFHSLFSPMKFLLYQQEYSTKEIS